MLTEPNARSIEELIIDQLHLPYTIPAVNVAMPVTREKPLKSSDLI